MTYEQAIAFIYSFQNFSKKPGLHRMQKMLDALGNPHKKLRFIHIAGTNGKGSTAAMLASILKEGGYKVGLYTSPYIYDFRERVQIDGKLIEKDLLIELVEKIAPLALQTRQEGDAIGVFEYITLLGFLAFERNACEVVILETGIGGRLDATNVIENPLISIITMIGMDHTEILGDTIGKITTEKCGIIKDKGITLTYPYQPEKARHVIEQQAKEKQNIFIHPEVNAIREVKTSLEATSFSYKNHFYQTPLLGAYQAANAVVVLEAVEVLRSLGYDVSEQALQNGLLKTKWPGRLELIHTHPTILVDGAHNVGGIEALVEFTKTLQLEPLTVVFGMMADKEYERALTLLAQCTQQMILLEPSEARGASLEVLLPIAKKLYQKVYTVENVERALALIYHEDDLKGSSIFCGSLHRIGEIKEALCKIEKRQCKTD